MSSVPDANGCKKVHILKGQWVNVLGSKNGIFGGVTIRIPTVIIPTFIIPTVGIMNVVCRYFEIAP